MDAGFVTGGATTTGGATDVDGGSTVVGGAIVVGTVEVIADELGGDEVTCAAVVVVPFTMDRGVASFLLAGLTADPIAPMTISAATTPVGMMKPLRWYH